MPNFSLETQEVAEVHTEAQLRHPLEPLNPSEIAQAVELLKSRAGFTTSKRIISIMLKEPPKEFVHGWPNSGRPDRCAIAVLLDNAANATSAVTLNLTKSEVVTVQKAPPGSQPTLSLDEQIECEQAVLTSPEFLGALKKQYGISDASLVMVDIWSAGNYGSEEDRTRRLTRPLCFLRSDPTDNGYARPIEGIRPVVDLNLMKVIRVEEYGHWPLPPNSGNYSSQRVPGQRANIKPLSISQPEGASFSLEGNPNLLEKLAAGDRYGRSLELLEPEHRQNPLFDSATSPMPPYQWAPVVA